MDVREIESQRQVALTRSIVAETDFCSATEIADRNYNAGTKAVVFKHAGDADAAGGDGRISGASTKASYSAVLNAGLSQSDVTVGAKLNVTWSATTSAGNQKHQPSTVNIIVMTETELEAGKTKTRRHEEKEDGKSIDFSLADKEEEEDREGDEEQARDGESRWRWTGEFFLDKNNRIESGIKGGEGGSWGGGGGGGGSSSGGRVESASCGSGKIVIGAGGKTGYAGGVNNAGQSSAGQSSGYAGTTNDMCNFKVTAAGETTPDTTMTEAAMTEATMTQEPEAASQTLSCKCVIDESEEEADGISVGISTECELVLF